MLYASGRAASGAAVFNETPGGARLFRVVKTRDLLIYSSRIPPPPFWCAVCCRTWQSTAMGRQSMAGGLVSLGLLVGSLIEQAHAGAHGYLRNANHNQELQQQPQVRVELLLLGGVLVTAEIFNGRNVVFRRRRLTVVDILCTTSGMRPYERGARCVDHHRFLSQFLLAWLKEI